MKVLFVGEGKHDIGRPEFAVEIRPAQGVVPTLARRVCPYIHESSVAIGWTEVPVLRQKPNLKGLAVKVRSSIALAVRHDCDGIVCVHDSDGEDDRLTDMTAGAAVDPTQRIVCGLAIKSIEAWTLGDPAAIANVLGVEVAEIRTHYRLQDVEEFSEGSGKPEKQPKRILSQLAALKHRTADVVFRQEIAENTDPAELAKNCANGFKPFAERLAAVFGPRQ
jgi:hypothetical protein